MWTTEEQGSYMASLGIDSQPGAVLHFMKDIFENAELPDSWIAKRDFDGRLFFSNSTSGQSSWVHPLDSTFRELAHACRECLSLNGEKRETLIQTKLGTWTSEMQTAIGKWYSVTDKRVRRGKLGLPKRPKVYYCHEETQETSWIRPEKSASKPYELKIRALGRLLDSAYLSSMKISQPEQAAADSSVQGVVRIDEQTSATIDQGTELKRPQAFNASLVLAELGFDADEGSSSEDCDSESLERSSGSSTRCPVSRASSPAASSHAPSQVSISTGSSSKKCRKSRRSIPKTRSKRLGSHAKMQHENMRLIHESLDRMELLLSQGSYAELEHQILNMKAALAEQPRGAYRDEPSECRYKELETSVSSPGLRDAVHPVSVTHFVYPDCCTLDCEAVSTKYFAIADTDDDHDDDASGDECAAASWEVGISASRHCESGDADIIASPDATNEQTDRIIDVPSVSCESTSKDAGMPSAELSSGKMSVQVHPRLMRAGFGVGSP